MKTRVLAGVAVALLVTLPLAGCVGTAAETADESGASQRDASCEIVVADLSEHIAQLAKSKDGLTTYGPSTMLSFHTGADEKLTTVATTLDDTEVKDAVLAVRDAAARFIPIWEAAHADPDTWHDGSLTADIAAADEATTTALAELGDLCPDVRSTDSRP